MGSVESRASSSNRPPTSTSQLVTLITAVGGVGLLTLLVEPQPKTAAERATAAIPAAARPTLLLRCIYSLTFRSIPPGGHDPSRMPTHSN